MKAPARWDVSEGRPWGDDVEAVLFLDGHPIRWVRSYDVEAGVVVRCCEGFPGSELHPLGEKHVDPLDSRKVCTERLTGTVRVELRRPS